MPDLSLGKMLSVTGMVLVSLMAGVPQSAAQEMTVGRLKYNPNMHPLNQVNNTKRNDLGFVSRTITAFDETGTNVCRLCEELPTIDNGLAKIVTRDDGGKGMEVTIKLREGLHWGDGEPLTSDDIAFTWEMANDPNIGFSNYNPWTRADRVEIVDDRTIIMHLPEVLRGYASWDQVIPEHIERPIYEEYPNAEEYVKQTEYNRNTANPGLWNGPFVFDSWDPGTLVTLKPNPHWPGPGPKLDRIALTYRDNNAALLQTLLAGELDSLAVSPGGISFSQMLDARKRYPDRFNYAVSPGTNMERIALNLDNPILADKKVRQALLTGIDRKAISDALFDGVQEVAHGPLNSNNPLYDEDALKIYTFDPEAASEMITEAGWTQGSDGICTNADGDRLSIELVTTSGDATREQIAQVIQSQLKDICVELTTKFVPLTEFSSVQKRERKFTGMLMGSIQFPPSASPSIVFGSNQIPTEDKNWVGENFSGYASEEMDGALQMVDSALTNEEATKGWSEVQANFSEDLPFLPLYFYAEAEVLANNVRDLEPGTIDPPTNWAEEWYLE